MMQGKVRTKARLKRAVKKQRKGAHGTSRTGFFCTCPDCRERWQSISARKKRTTLKKPNASPDHAHPGLPYY